MKKNINGDLLTLEQAYNKHKNLIASPARSYEAKGKAEGFEIEDLFSVGKIGFVEAFQKYDDKSHYRFSTYATSVIVGRIKDEIYNKSGKERIGERIKKRSREFAALELEEISVSSIRKALNMHYIYAYEVFHYLVHKDSVYLEKPLRGKTGASQICVVDTLKTKSDFTRVTVEQFKELLTDKEIIVFELLMQGFCQKEIQSILGLKRSAVNMRVVRMREKYKYMAEG